MFVALKMPFDLRHERFVATGLAAAPANQEMVTCARCGDVQQPHILQRAVSLLLLDCVRRSGGHQAKFFAPQLRLKTLLTG